MTDRPLSPEYVAALAAHDLALEQFTKARTAYRQLKIGNAEFIAAKRVYEASCVVFDAAFEKERES